LRRLGTAKNAPPEVVKRQRGATLERPPEVRVHWVTLRSKSGKGEWESGIVGEVRALRILVVEDDEPAARSLRVLLNLRGHVVECVHTGADAVALAAELSFDLLICDLNLPDFSGFEVMGLVRERHPTIRGIAVSGMPDYAHVETALAVGFRRYLSKPFTADELFAAVAETTAGL
jgi:CheY-like chemotaxis protein